MLNPVSNIGNEKVELKSEGSDGSVLSGVKVPKDVLHLIFKQLTPEELFKVGQVCKFWLKIASNDSLWKSYHLRRVFPKATFIDKQVWKTHVDVDKHGLDLKEKGCPYVTRSDYIEIKRMESQIEKKKGITILTLPKGLTFNKVVAFAASPKMGNKTDFRSILRHISVKLGDKEVAETMTVATTNGVFIESRNKSVHDQKELVKELKCEMPGLVPVAACAMMRFISSDSNHPVRLFGDDPLTFMRCEEEINGWRVLFGSFDLYGPFASISYHDYLGSMNEGIGGLRKFKVIKSKI